MQLGIQYGNKCQGERDPVKPGLSGPIVCTCKIIECNMLLSICSPSTYQIDMDKTGFAV